MRSLLIGVLVAGIGLCLGLSAALLQSQLLGCQSCVKHHETYKISRYTQGEKTDGNKPTTKINEKYKSIDTGQKAYTHQTNSNEKVKDSLQEMWSLIATIGIGIATIAVYAYQAYLMRKTLIQANRAYLHVQTFSFEFAQGQDGRIWAHIGPIWENTGNTPTRKAVVRLNVRSFQGEMPKNFSFPDLGVDSKEWASKLLIGPKHTIPAQREALSPEVIVSNRLGFIKTYMWGWIEYKDVFWMTPIHRTEFSSQIVFHSGMLPGDMQFSASMLWEYNGADEDCLHEPGKNIPKAEHVHLTRAQLLPDVPAPIAAAWRIPIPAPPQAGA